ncbi:hypothetical protein [Janthinobacterium lividum]|uniref:Uncharacterized protein n=1 Tax=Janthinobacterium lividum TaxID=29581 RepID=A0ABU0XLL6_9BURK|nr:hypothetical protein [Janthinobacterium lividum]MDQ4624410.1 hypothetical protein [Janthinobacterium lividum]MDQ4673986.1 hypothetical protein [Janthinobacterium lividum]MDQ4684716.1 hypothetical protein [Janthinobacterium lividum]
MKTLPFCVATLFISISACPVVAQEPESCGDILRYASRDVRHDVSFSDQRKYYYKNVCTSSNTGLGIDYKDATSALGLSYTSKDAYCKGEQSFDTNTSYSQADSSLVVRNSLDAYVACRALSTKGVATSVSMPANDSPTVFSISVQRKSAAPQSVESLAIDPAAVSCNAQTNGEIQTLNKEFNVIGFQLPQSEAQWSLICSRKPFINPATANRTYAPVQLILTTSSGALPISLPQIGYAAGAWASELRSDAMNLSKKVTLVEATLAGQKIIAQCSGDGWLPVAAAPVCPAGFKDSGQFSHSAPGGKHGFGGNCRICLGSQ